MTTSFILDMKKISIFISIIVVLIAIILIGFIFQNYLNNDENNSVFITAPVNSLGIQQKYLPDNVKQFFEIYNDTEEIDFFSDDNITKLEQYTVDYRYNETESEYLLVEIKKIESIEGAKKIFNNQNELFIETFGNDIKNIQTEKLGDESIFAKIISKYHLFLRKANIIITLTSASDEDITENDMINYASIILNNIESSIES